MNECFEALGSGEAEYVACDATAGAYLARAYPGTVFVATLSSLASYGLILPADGGNLASAVEDALAAIESDGTLDAIYRSWYGSLPFGFQTSNSPDSQLPLMMPPRTRRSTLGRMESW